MKAIELRCWIEIKAAWPDKEEENKARLLAWHTGKQVYILYGDVWLPNADGAEANLYDPIEVFAQPLTGGEHSSRKIDLPLDLSGLLMQIHQLKITLGISLAPTSPTLLAMSTPPEDTPLPLRSALRRMEIQISQWERQIRELPALMEKVELRKLELVTATAAVFPNYDSSLSLNITGLQNAPLFKWLICKKCGKIHMHSEFFVHGHCGCYSEGGEDCQGNEERLFAAYTWARQARFDGKDTFPWQK